MNRYLIPFIILKILALPISAAELAWIWKSGKIESEEANFKTTIKLDKKPKSAPVMVTCDNTFELFINGEKVAASKNWKNAVHFDIAHFLDAGVNHILAECDNEGNTAGFIMTLDVDGKKLVTDKSWMAQAHEGEWHQAVIVKKYGHKPWGNVFQKPANLKKVKKSTKPPRTIPLATLPWFKAEKIYDVDKKKEGSWVGMTVDPKGRLITTDQHGGIYRVTLKPKVSVEKLNVKVSGGHGLLYAFDSLYVMSGEGKQKGVYRLTDTNGDDQYDKEEYLITMKSKGEHGCHSLVLSPDKKSIYIVGGNNTDMPKSANAYRMSTAWKEDHILPRMADGRGHNKGRLAPGGFIMKISPDAKTQEVICTGFRNQFDAAFNIDGELFSFDADMEYDIGAPWYRPTRVNHVVSGVDWGWRNGSGKWPEYYTDTLPATINIGPGSPTGVCSGLGARFPAKYQKAIFINDWTYGTMFAIHLEKDGATYKATREEFVSGKPLPLTDVIIHPDGDMYFMVGGRRTTSALYRLTYVGSESTAAVKASPLSSGIKLRRKIESLHEQGVGEVAIAKALPYIGHEDRFIRHAARVALEKQPVAKWQQQIGSAKSPWAVIELATALARSGSKGQQSNILKALNKLDYKNMKTPQLLAAIRSYQLAFARLGQPSSLDASSVTSVLNSLYPHKDNFVNRELSQVLLYLRAPSAVSRTVEMVLNAVDSNKKQWDTNILQRNDRYAAAAKRNEQFRPNVQQFALAFSLRTIKDGWTDADHASYFSWFPRAKTWQGGNSFGAFIENSRKNALANVKDSNKRKKYDKISSKSLAKPRAIQPPVGPGRVWTVKDAVAAVEGNMKGRDFKRGENLYHAAACASCHRFAGEGMGIGPDLTGSANRYSLEDMMENIILPSKVISDQYISTEFTMNNGDKVIGREADKENGIIHLMTNPYSAESTVQIKAADVKKSQLHRVSQMPAGLINSMNADELSDLIAYIFSAGNTKHEYFVQMQQQFPPKTKPEEGRSLFNGKDLAGWKGDPELWSVKDGVIHGTSHGKKLKQNTFLIYESDDLEDFHLTYEARCKGNNSGVMYRSEVLDEKEFIMRGSQCDLHPKPEYLAMLYEEKGRRILTKRGQTMVINEAGKKKVVSSSKPEKINTEDWATYEIICKGNHIIHKVNGEVAIDLTDNDKKRIKKGKIGLQLHQGKPMTVDFRNIRLKILK